VESPSWLASAIEVEEGLEVAEPRLEGILELLGGKIKSVPLPARLRSAVESYVSNYAKLVYVASLALEKLSSKRTTA